MLAPNGKLVEVLATEARIIDTADPSKAAIAARHEEERIQRGVRAVGSSSSSGEWGQGADFQKAKAHREYFLAQLAETEFHKVQGKLVEAETVRNAAFDAGRMLRDALLGLPAQIAGELASLTNPWDIDRNLAAALRRVLDETERLSAADLNKSLTTTS